MVSCRFCKLEILDLDNNRIGNFGVRYLGMADFCVLRRLHLCTFWDYVEKCNISD